MGFLTNLFGKKQTSKFEVELAGRLGAERAAEIVRELGPDIVKNPVIDRSPDLAAEAIKGIAMLRGAAASPHEIAGDFVQQLLKRL